jgi:hypothetical protein
LCFAEILTGQIPVEIFVQNGGTLPPGFDLDIFRLYIDIYEYYATPPQQNLSVQQLEWILNHPDVIPVIWDILDGPPAGEEASMVRPVLSFAVTNGLSFSNTQFQFLITHGLVFEQLKNVTTQADLTNAEVSWLLDEGNDVIEQFDAWLDDFDTRDSDVDLIHRILQFRMNNDENDINAAKTFLATELEAVFQQYGMALPANVNEWTPDFWEILWDVLKETVPELIPGLDTAIEFKNAIQSANNGNWGESTVHFIGAILTITPWDKIKDSYKLAKAIHRGNRWFDLIKRCSGYNDEMAQGLRNILKKELNNPHIFRKAPGHLPDLNPAITAAGGADNLLFDVYKKIHDDGLAAGMNIGELRTRDISIHGLTLRVQFRRHADAGPAKIEIGDFWKP